MEPYEVEEVRVNAAVYRDARYKRKMIVGPTDADRWLTVIIETDGTVVTAMPATDKVRKL